MAELTHPSPPTAGDTIHDPAAEALSLRRKVLFWRRALLFVLGLATIVVIVAWQRTSTRARECSQALRHYGNLALSSGLGNASPELLELQWQQLRKDRVHTSAAHYRTIQPNWMRQPAPGEAMPLAICRDSHIAFLSRGRHVLYRDDQKLYVEWISEEEAELLLKSFRLDEP